MSDEAQQPEELSETQPVGRRDPTPPAAAPRTKRRKGAEPTLVVTSGTPTPSIPGVSILGEIGQGGMGVVYKGIQVFLERPVAVKMLRPGSYGHEFERRFKREARILAGLAHPNIVSCHQAGVTPAGEYYIVMEFIDGPTLRQHLNGSGPLGVLDALVLCREVAVALGHAHQSGIIHRDVKPENVLLQHDERAEELGAFPYRAKLADLGLARPLTSTSSKLTLTAPGAVMGTPSTMAPEQFDDPDKVDWRADIYALGCTLFHTTTGEMAFRQRTISQLMAAKSSSTQPDAHHVLREVPQRVSEFARQLYAPFKEQRLQSYDEIVARFDELIRLERIAPQPARPRSRRWIALAGGAGIVVAGAGAWAIYHRPSSTEPDRTPPRITDFPPQVPAVADGTCMAVLPDLTTKVKAEDDGSEVTVVQFPAAGKLMPLGESPIKLTVRDAQGNRSECSTKLLVVDDTDPKITGCARDQTAQAGASGQLPLPDFTKGVVASDECTVVTVAQLPPAGTLVGPGETPVTLTVSDEAGNSSRCEAKFIVQEQSVLPDPPPLFALAVPEGVLHEGQRARFAVTRQGFGADVAYAWSVETDATSPGVVLTDRSARTVSFDLPPAVEDYSIIVRPNVTIGGKPLSEPLERTLAVQVNHPPLVRIEGTSESLEAGQPVVLRAVATDRDKDTSLTYRWTQSSSVAGLVLGDTGEQALSFVTREAPGDYELVLALDVSDGEKTTRATWKAQVASAPELRPLEPGAKLDLLAGLSAGSTRLPPGWSAKSGTGMIVPNPERPDCIACSTSKDSGVSTSRALPRGPWTLEGWITLERMPASSSTMVVSLLLDRGDEALALNLTRTVDDEVSAGWVAGAGPAAGAQKLKLDEPQKFRARWNGNSLDVSLGDGSPVSFPGAARPRNLILQVRGAGTMGCFGGLRLSRE